MAAATPGGRRWGHEEEEGSAEDGDTDNVRNHGVERNRSTTPRQGSISVEAAAAGVAEGSENRSGVVERVLLA